MTDLQQRLSAALRAAGKRGIDCYAMGETQKASTAYQLARMVKEGLAYSYEPATRQKQRKWFDTAEHAQQHQAEHAQPTHPLRKRKPGRPSERVMHWADDAVVVQPDHVQVQYGVGVQLGLRTNTHRNGL